MEKERKQNSWADFDRLFDEAMNETADAIAAKFEGPCGAEGEKPEASEVDKHRSGGEDGDETPPSADGSPKLRWNDVELDKAFKRLSQCWKFEFVSREDGPHREIREQLRQLLGYARNLSERGGDPVIDLDALWEFYIPATVDLLGLREDMYKLKWRYDEKSRSAAVEGLGLLRIAFQAMVDKANGEELPSTFELLQSVEHRVAADGYVRGAEVASEGEGPEVPEVDKHRAGGIKDGEKPSAAGGSPKLRWNVVELDKAFKSIVGSRFMNLLTTDCSDGLHYSAAQCVFRQMKSFRDYTSALLEKPGEPPAIDLDALWEFYIPKTVELLSLCDDMYEHGWRYSDEQREEARLALRKLNRAYQSMLDKAEGREHPSVHELSSAIDARLEADGWV